jgi:F0F1-type ATP synthase assembly protein I
MASKKRQSRKKQAKQAQNQPSQPQKKAKEPFKRPNKLKTMSRLTLALYFFIPLIFGEVLLYLGDRTISMGLLLLAWLGFWAALLSTSNWAPLIKRKEQPGENQ